MESLDSMPRGKVLSNHKFMIFTFKLPSYLMVRQSFDANLENWKIMRIVFKI